MPTSVSMSEELDIQWGKAKSQNMAKTFYSSFISEGIEYDLYDNVDVYNGNQGGDDRSDVYIGKIVKLWEEKESGMRKVLIRWFLKREDVSQEIEGDPRELFLAFGMGKGVTNENELEVICGKCKVLCTSKDDRNRQPSTRDLRTADFFFSKIYNVDLQRLSPIERVVDKLGCEAVYNKPEWVTEIPNNNEKAVEHLTSVLDRKKESTLKRKSLYMVESPSDLKDSQGDTDVINETQQKSRKGSDVKSQMISNMNEAPQNKQSRTSATTSLPTKVATANKIQKSENISSFDEVVANKSPTSGDFKGSQVEQEELGKTDFPAYAPAQTVFNASNLEQSLSSAKISVREIAALKLDDALGHAEPDEKESVENNALKEACIDGQGIRKDILNDQTNQANTASNLLEEGEKNLHEKIEMNSTASKLRVKGEIEGAVQAEVGISPERKGRQGKGDSSSLSEPGQVVKESVVKEVTSYASKKAILSTGSDLEKKLILTTEAVKVVENWKIFKVLPWEQNLQQGILSGRVLLLHNLDPCLTSADVCEMLKNILQGVSDVRIMPQETICPHAQALAIFDSKLLAESALEEMERKCLVIANSKRPIIATKFKEISNISRFPGHLALDKPKLSRNIGSEEYKKAVSTSHCSQPNTIEYEMAMEWRRLQEIIQTCRAELFEKQRKEMEERRKSRGIEVASLSWKS